MKIYTKTGDKGTTSLLGGRKVPKHAIRIETYGTLDELNAHIGMIMALMHETHPQLTQIQEEIFTLGAQFANDPEKELKMTIPQIEMSSIIALEKSIDQMEEDLPPMKNFILPGGNTLVAQIHISRCVCRRAERLATLLESEENIPEFAIQYLNRLSDFLFVLARFMAKKTGAEEIPWKTSRD